MLTKCDRCGKQINRAPVHIKKFRTKTCSECRQIQNRINFFTQKTAFCWLWTGAKTKAGYGIITHKGKSKYVHRLPWELSKGQIPQGMDICHKCDVPNCVNPNHLFVGTRLENVHDCIRKMRHVFGEGHHFHKLTSVEVKKIRNSYSKGATQTSIAKQFQITSGHICDIVHLKKRVYD